MKDGLYKIQFNTPRGRAAGVLYISNEKAYGGDAGLFYVGSIKIAGSLVAIDLTVAPHTEFPGVVSVFGVNEVKIVLQGTLNGDEAICVGSLVGRPDFTFNVVFAPLCI